jgi:TPR repeat protein
VIGAAKYYKLAADQNHARAQFNYGICLANGRGVSVDLIGAAKYYKLAADQNHALAQCNYGVCLANGRGVSVDVIGAAKYYKLAADQNHAGAQSNYGVCRQTGRGVEINLEDAVSYYGRDAGLRSVGACEHDALPTTANSGDPLALFRLGRCLEFGHGVAKNAALAAHFYELAAAQGHDASQVKIGFFRERGIGVEQDIVEGVRNYEAAAQSQNRDAMAYCGLCTQYGIGFDVNLDEAASIYLSLASQSILENHSLRCLLSLNKARNDDYSLPKRRQPRTAAVDNVTGPVTVPLSMDDYRTSPVGVRRSELIATGGFGTVRVMDDPARNRKIAVQHFADVCDTEDVLREVATMVKLNHPCVLRILNWAPPEGRSEAEIHTEFAAHGSLEAVLKKVNAGEKPPFWTPTGIGILICSLVLGMRYVHSRRIIHHDLKPSNILVNGKEHVWICDFGASRSEDDETPENGTGTIGYAAPEQYEEGVVCTTKCDVFTFGLVLYEILVGDRVFPLLGSQFDVIRRLFHRDLPVLPANHGQLMQTLLVDCWEQDPADRPSFDEIFERFDTAEYKILPDADHIRIRSFVDGILAWERKTQIS